MATVTQENRQLAIETPLGKDVLLLTAFTGHEEISRLFRFELDMLSEQDSIAAKDIVGKNVTFSVLQADGKPRYFNGLVSRFSAGSTETGFRRYRAEVVPWLWFLTRTANCRIFQEKSVPDILEEVFGGKGKSDLGSLQGDHPAWEYCVQYRETDFNFVSRLMEHEGIFYFFKHEKGEHTLVLGDAKSAYQWCPEKEIEHEHSVSSRAHRDRITEWEHTYEFRPGKSAHTDYDFKKPSTSLLVDADTIVDLPGVADYEIYDYPGTYTDKHPGKGLVRLRMEEEEAAHDVVNGASTCKTLTPGGKFTIKKHDVKSENDKSYVVCALRHTATEPSQFVGGGQVGQEYSNRFTCVPDSINFRPARITPKPVVQGPQTAVIVGPDGEEIHTDSYSRVKVKFHWDRDPQKNQNSSCWIRVSQAWAGKNWGIIFIPRIGQEVIVDFLEGDPDQPIITGRVYNAEQMPPYPLPDNQTKSTIKTRSSMDGSPDNFNEIRFEDKKGEEQLFIHAEKNQDIEVENDETHWVGHDRSKTIDRDEKTHVKRDRMETVDRNETISIGNNRTESVGANEAITIGKNRTTTVEKSESISVGDNRNEQVGKDEQVSIGGDRRHTIGKTDTLDVGKTYTLQAADAIVLKTGKASITMKKNGDIEIKGKNIKVTASGKINEKASSTVTIKGSKVLVN